MGLYIVESDIDDFWGTVNVTDWSDLSGDAARDTNRIDRSIAYAEQRINNRFRQSRYAIPFVFIDGIDEVVKDWAAALAGWWLYRGRGLRDEGAGERITRVIHGDSGTEEIGIVAGMGRYLAGQETFNAALVEIQPGAPIAVTSRTPTRSMPRT